MKIWGFATGGHVIQFNGDTEYYRIRGVIWPRRILVHRRWGVNGMLLTIMTREHLSTFNLLGQVCRQMRAETHIAPFENNIFHFEGFRVFKRFVDGISKTQMEAIREISFGGTPGFSSREFDDENRDFPSDVRRGVAGILPPNLKRIYLEPKNRMSRNMREYWYPGHNSMSYDIEEVRDFLGLDADEGQGPLGVKVLVLYVHQRKQGINNALQVFDI